MKIKYKQDLPSCSHILIISFTHHGLLILRAEEAPFEILHYRRESQGSHQRLCSFWQPHFLTVLDQRGISIKRTRG